jgi:cytochrome b561
LEEVVMSRPVPAGYSLTQIMLHWAIALLVTIQIVAHDGIEESFDAFLEGAAPGAGDLRLANLHVICGALIFLLMIWRVTLRLRRGAPALPENEPRAAKMLAHAVHGLFYLLLIAMPISGAVAWFGGVEAAGNAHGAASTLLLVLIGLHLAGVLVQFFVFGSNVLARMTMAEE